MSCLETPSKCQAYLLPAARDYSNPATKSSLMCVESEGSKVNKTASCMNKAAAEELKDPKSPRNIFNLLQCTICMGCANPDDVPEDIKGEFNCSNVKPSGNWDGDWQKFVNDNGGSAGGGSGGFDWQQYTNGGGGGGSSSGGFDWQQYVNGGDDGSHSSSSSSSGSSSGGFDWQQYVPGGMQSSSAPEGEWDSYIPDWRSFIPNNQKHQGEDFDWHVYVEGFD